LTVTVKIAILVFIWYYFIWPMTFFRNIFI
jgi:hypothetical protein